MMSEKWFYQGINEEAISKSDFYKELISTIWTITATTLPDYSINADSSIEGDSEGGGSNEGDGEGGGGSEGDCEGGGGNEGNSEGSGGGKDIFGVGFCIDARGLILTCNHVTVGQDSPLRTILCENLGNGVIGQAKVLINMPKWDISLLQLYDIQMPRGVISRNLTFDYVKIGDELDEVFCGQDVFAVGDPGGLTGTFMMGIVAYTCDGYNMNLLHENYNKEPITTRARIKDRNQSFRSMGNIAQDINVRDDDNSLSPNLPIIQISTMSGDAGASGCPIFNKRGCVVGMLLSSLPNQILAAHYSAIKYFIKHVWGGRGL